MSGFPSSKSRRSSVGKPGGAEGGEPNNSDSIKVLCRFRPGRQGDANASSSRRESARFDANTNTEVIDNFKLNEEYNEIEYMNDIADNKIFKFDKVFGSKTTQVQMFNEVKGTIDAVMAGFNGTIMAYGQTSAGKSFSMEGLSLRDPSTQGIIPRCVDRLFDEIEEADEDNQFQVILSFYEIYCEKVRDLLNPQQVNLKLRETKNSGFIVQDITEIYCTDRESVLRVIEFGKANRAAAPTLMNAESSRSHSIVSILVDQKNTTTGRNKKGNLYLVDLAGSEKVSKTGASGMRLEEAKNINGSLTTLGMVINALCDNQGHIPYRDSKLTMILMDALGGNSKTTLIICCNPEHKHTPETLSTLRFGERAKRIKNHARVNEEYSAEELKQMLLTAKREISQLKTKLQENDALLEQYQASGGLSPGGTSTMEASAMSVSSQEIKQLETWRQEKEELLQEKEVMLNELASLKAKIGTLEEELETERMKLKDEQEEHMELATESQALKTTIAELEEKLLKSSLNSKKSAQSLKTSRSFFENNQMQPLDPGITPPPINTEFSFDEVDESNVSTPDFSRARTPRTPRSTTGGDEVEDGLTSNSVSMADLQEHSKTINEHFEKQIKELTSSINEQQIEAKTAQASAQNFAEKYVKLREEYELHVQRLMMKLTQEQQARTQTEDKLEEAYHKLWQQQGGKSSSAFGIGRQSSVSGGGGGSGGGGLWSWFGGNSNNNGGFNPSNNNNSKNNSSTASRTMSFNKGGGGFSDREQNIARALELAQFRVSQLVAELEANKEAQSIVLETKESVMRSLARQNSQLTLERDQLMRRVDELTQDREKLTSLVRDLQQTRKELPSQEQASVRRRVLKGGVASKERTLLKLTTDLPASELPKTNLSEDIQQQVGEERDA